MDMTQEMVQKIGDHQEVISLKCFYIKDIKNIENLEENIQKTNRFSIRGKIGSEVCNICIFIHNSPRLEHNSKGKLELIEIISKINKKTFGSFVLKKNHLFYKFSIVYLGVPESMYSTMIIDHFSESMRVIRKYREKLDQISKKIKFKTFKDKTLDFYTPIPKNIGDIILNDPGLDYYFDVKNVVKGKDKKLYYYAEESNALEQIFYEYQQVPSKFFYTSFNSKVALEAKQILRLYDESLRTIEKKCNFKFKDTPIEPSVENPSWNKHDNLYDINPFKVGFFKLPEYIQAKDYQDDELKSNTSTIENDYFYSVTKSLKDWESSLKHYSRLNIEYFEDPELTKESKKFGKGGFGEVFENVYCGNKVAIKFELPSRKSLRSKQIFFSEYFTTRRVNHKNILKILGWIMFEGRLGIVMKYYKYGSLAQYLKDSDSTESDKNVQKLVNKYIGKYGKFNIERKLQVGIRLGHTFAALKHRKLIHFDIKPHNIYMSKAYSPVIADFGLAKIKEKPTDIVKVNGCSVFYCPPEQIININSDFPADIWAYGCVLYFLFQLKHPFYYIKLQQKKNVKDKHMYLDFIHNHLKRPIFKPDFEDRYPELCEVIRDCWNFEPDKRILAEDAVEVLLNIYEELKVYPRE